MAMIAPTEADEHERALTLEISFQRRQWDRILKIEALLESQEARTSKLEQQAQGELERLQRLEEQADMLHETVCGLVDSYTEAGRILATECETRQQELGTLQVALTNCEASLSEAICDSARELRSSLDGLYRQSQDTGAHCKELERRLSDEQQGWQQEHRALQAALASLQAGARDSRASEMRVQQELRSVVAVFQKQRNELMRESFKELSKLLQMKHQESSKLVQDCISRCRRDAQEGRDTCTREYTNLCGHFAELKRKCGEMIHDLAEDLNQKQLAAHTCATDIDKRCGLALTDLGCRVDELEHDFFLHTHEITATKTYHCGRAVRGTSASVSAGARGGRPLTGKPGMDEISQASAKAGAGVLDPL